MVKRKGKRYDIFNKNFLYFTMLFNLNVDKHLVSCLLNITQFHADDYFYEIIGSELEDSRSSVNKL